MTSIRRFDAPTNFKNADTDERRVRDNAPAPDARLRRIKELDPFFKNDGASDAYLDTYLAALEAPAAPPAWPTVAGPVLDADGESEIEKAQRELRERSANAWKKSR